jgi:hypothetical protein
MLDGHRAIRDSEDSAHTADPWRWIRRQFGGVVRAIAPTDKLFVAAINGRGRVGRLSLVPEVDELVAHPPVGLGRRH